MKLARDVMHSNPLTVVRPATPMHEVARLMTQDRFSLVPVLENGELVGVITRRSIIAAAAAGGVAVRDELIKPG